MTKVLEGLLQEKGDDFLGDWKKYLNDSQGLIVFLQARGLTLGDAMIVLELNHLANTQGQQIEVQAETNELLKQLVEALRMEEDDWQRGESR